MKGGYFKKNFVLKNYRYFQVILETSRPHECVKN